MQEAPLVSLQLPKKLLLPHGQMAAQTEFLVQLLLSVTHQLHGNLQCWCQAVENALV